MRSSYSQLTCIKLVSVKALDGFRAVVSVRSNLPCVNMGMQIELTKNLLFFFKYYFGWIPSRCWPAERCLTARLLNKDGKPKNSEDLKPSFLIPLTLGKSSLFYKKSKLSCKPLRKAFKNPKFDSRRILDRRRGRDVIPSTKVIYSKPFQLVDTRNSKSVKFKVRIFKLIFEQFKKLQI